MRVLPLKVAGFASLAAGPSLRPMVSSVSEFSLVAFLHAVTILGESSKHYSFQFLEQTPKPCHISARPHATVKLRLHLKHSTADISSSRPLTHRAIFPALSFFAQSLTSSPRPNSELLPSLAGCYLSLSAMHFSARPI